MLWCAQNLLEAAVPQNSKYSATRPAHTSSCDLHYGAPAAALTAVAYPHKYASRHNIHTFATPAEVALLKAQCAVLQVTAAAADQVDALGAHLCHRRRAAHLELALLLVRVLAAAGCAPLVARIAGDSCADEIKKE